jgi:hypothetical protein
MHILYEGPSQIDGGPIFAALTGLDRPSANSKTGPMLQTWILRQDVRPVEANKLGLDVSVCGDCPHRKGTCYVNVAQSPTAVYDSYINGFGKRDSLKKLGRNQRIRIGAYGDPASVPITVWDDLLRYANSWTGYTHQALLQPELKRYCQASADTVEEAKLYQNLGWKTYRVKNENDPLAKEEIICPSNKGVQCITCLKCNGNTQNIAIDVHGLQWKINKFKEHSHAKHRTTSAV